MKKILYVFVALVISVFCFSACTPKTPPKEYVDLNGNGKIDEWEKDFVRVAPSTSYEAPGRTLKKISTVADLLKLQTGETNEDQLVNNSSGSTTGSSTASSASGSEGASNAEPADSSYKTGRTKDDYYVLQCDIDLGGEEIYPLDLGEATLFGNGYTISNFKLKPTIIVYPNALTNEDTTSLRSYASLFANGTLVRDLNIHTFRLDYVKRPIGASNSDNNAYTNGKFSSLSLFCGTKTIDNVNVRGLINVTRAGENSSDNNGSMSFAVFSAGYTITDTSINSNVSGTTLKHVKNRTIDIKNSSFEGEISVVENSNPEKDEYDILSVVKDINEYGQTISNMDIKAYKVDIKSKRHTVFGGISAINHGLISHCELIGNNKTGDDKVDSIYSIQNNAYKIDKLQQMHVGTLVGESKYGANSKYDGFLNEKNQGEAQIRYTHSDVLLSVDGKFYNDPSSESHVDQVCNDWTVGGLVGDAQGGYYDYNIVDNQINTTSTSNLVVGGMFGTADRVIAKNNIGRADINVNNASRGIAGGELSGNSYISSFAGIFTNGYYGNCIANTNITIQNSYNCNIGLFGQVRSMDSSKNYDAKYFPSLNTVTHVGDVTANTNAVSGNNRNTTNTGYNVTDISIARFNNADKYTQNLLGFTQIVNDISLNANLTKINDTDGTNGGKIGDDDKTYQDPLIKQNSTFSGHYNFNTNVLTYNGADYTYDPAHFDIYKIGFVKPTKVTSVYDEKHNFGSTGEQITYRIDVPVGYDPEDTSSEAVSLYSSLSNVISTVLRNHANTFEKSDYQYVNIVFTSDYISAVLQDYNKTKKAYDASKNTSTGGTTTEPSQSSTPEKGSEENKLISLEPENMDKFIYALNGDQNDSWVQYAFLFALSEMNYANTNIFDDYSTSSVTKSENSIYSWYENGMQYNKNEFKPMENKGEELDILYRIITNIENFDITNIGTGEGGTQSITGKYSCAMSLIFAFANSQNG